MTLSGESARATAPVDGRHYLAGEIWRPIGQYHWELSKREDGWLITRMVFEMTAEQGSRALLQQVMDRAADTE